MRVPVEERSPKGHGGFPSKKTFMASEVSPVKRILVTQTGDNQESVTATNIQAETGEVFAWKLRYIYNIIRCSGKDQFLQDS